jgi:YVTN family beta-propeller protein
MLKPMQRSVTRVIDSLLIAFGLFILLGIVVAALSCSPKKSERELRLYVGQFDLPNGTGRVLIYSVPELNFLGQLRANEVPGHLATRPGGEEIWVSGEASRDLLLLSAPTDSLVRRINVRSTLMGGAFTSDGALFVVANSAVVVWGNAENKVTLVDAEALQVLTQIEVGEDPRAVCIGPDDRFAYVANTGSSAISVVDLEAQRVQRTVRCGPAPHGVAVDPAGRWLYVACVGEHVREARAQGVLQIYALPDLELLASVSAGRHPSSVTPSADGALIAVGEMWTRPGDEARLRLYEVEALPEDGMPALSLWRELAAGENPLHADISPDGQWLVTVDSVTGMLTLVDLAKGEVAQQVKLLGAAPSRLAADAAFGWHGESTP